MKRKSKLTPLEAVLLGLSSKDVMNLIEAELFRNLMKLCDGSIQECANIAGITRQGLMKKRDRLKMDRDPKDTLQSYVFPDAVATYIHLRADLKRLRKSVYTGRAPKELSALRDQVKNLLVLLDQAIDSKHSA